MTTIVEDPFEAYSLNTALYSIVYDTHISMLDHRRYFTSVLTIPKYPKILCAELKESILNEQCVHFYHVVRHLNFIQIIILQFDFTSSS